MNKILILITIFTINMANAQNNTNIVGLYNLASGSSSPESPSHLIVLEDNRFAITYFGGIQTGKWAVVGENRYRFTPHTKETRFELFGRLNKELGSSTKIAFNGFEHGETFIQLRNSTDDDYNMQRIFNEGANCFSYPYVHTFETSAGSISFLSIDYEEENNPILTFKNPDGYNDFVARFIETDDALQPFLVMFKDKKLYFKDGNSSEQSPLKEDDEDIEFIKHFMDHQMNNNTLYLNPSYNMFGGPESNLEIEDLHKYYTFNTEKNAFINTKYYVEGEEHVESDDSFDKMSIIYTFDILKNYTTDTAKYKIDENPLFHAICD